MKINKNKYWIFFKRILRPLRPPVPIKEIKDEVKVKEKYDYWRIRIFCSMYVGYVFYYFTRKSFTFVMPDLIKNLGFDKGSLGIVATVLYVSYGISKFFSGVMSDQSNPRYFMSVGLIVTGLTNVLFGLSSSLVMFAILWGLNGWFQGWGWPPCARLLTHWYSKSERGTWWSVWSTSHNVGGFLIPNVISLLIQAGALYFGSGAWRFAMFINGGICIIVGFIIMASLRDTPQSLGLPTIEKYRNDYSGSPDQKNGQKEKELTTREILFEYVLVNKWIWMLAFASFFVYIVRTGVGDWSALYLLEEIQGCSILKANSFASMFEMGGLFGMLVAGLLSDKVSKGKRGPMNVMFSIGMLFSVAWFGGRAIVAQFFPDLNIGYIWSVFGPYTDLVMLFSVGFFLFGPQMLIGLAAAELSHKKAAGTASGFAGWFAYFGAAFSGYPLGKIVDSFGWGSFFLVLLLCCGITIILFLPMWNARSKQIQ